jgi:hypothetical protein
MRRRSFADSSVPDALESQNARCTFNAPCTDESAERLADASVAPGRSLPFFLSVLGGLELLWLGGEKIRQEAPSTNVTQTQF